jgi:hypothetical protein
MSAQPKLRIVGGAPIDITAKLRTDIMARNWAACHVAADKRHAIDLPATRKWSWAK